MELRRGGPFLCPPGDRQPPNDRIMRALRAQLVLETARCPDRSTPPVARRADTRGVCPAGCISVDPSSEEGKNRWARSTSGLAEKFHGASSEDSRQVGVDVAAAIADNRCQ